MTDDQKQPQLVDMDPSDPELSPDHIHGYISNKRGYINRLKRIEGQIRGLQRMIEEDKYCIDIITQASAVTKGVERVSLGLLEDHLNHCVIEAAEHGGDYAKEKVQEAAAAIARLMR